MPKKKEVLTEEFTPEEVVLIDEAGKELTYQEALAEELRLESMMETFFATNPALIQGEAQEEVDDEDITITVSKEGEVVKEEVLKTTESEAKEILVPAIPSMVEDEILRQVISAHIEKLQESYDKFLDESDNLYVLSNGDKIFDKVCDSYRKERRELNGLLFSGTVSFDALENEILKEVLKQELREFVKKMFLVVKELAN